MVTEIQQIYNSKVSPTESPGIGFNFNWTFHNSAWQVFVYFKTTPKVFLLCMSPRFVCIGPRQEDRINLIEIKLRGRVLHFRSLRNPTQNLANFFQEDSNFYADTFSGWAYVSYLSSVNQRSPMAVRTSHGQCLLILWLLSALRLSTGGEVRFRALTEKGIHFRKYTHGRPRVTETRRNSGSWSMVFGSQRLEACKWAGQ